MQRTHLASLQWPCLLSVLLFYPDHQLVLQILANFPVLIRVKRFVIIFVSLASARRTAFIFNYNLHTALPGWFSNHFVRSNLFNKEMLPCHPLKDMSTFIRCTVPGSAQLPSQMYVPGSGSQISLLSSVKQAFACEIFCCLPQRKKTLFQGYWMTFLLLGVLPWGRLSQVRRVTAGNLSTLFLALLIRQRLICMQWLVFLAGILVGLWRILWWAPRTPPSVCFSQSCNVNCVMPKNNHRLFPM